ncbi:hypothetical protein Esti_002969 [Eimeria stiedai]
MGKASNRSTVERLIQRKREQEDRNNALKKAVAERLQLVNSSRSDARVEALRRRKATEADLRELALDVAFTVEEQQMQQKAKGQELRERIASQLEKQQQERQIAELQKQQICMESAELRKLKEQLTAAQVNRERAAQVLERRLREADAAIIDARLDLEMEEKRLAECEESRRQELERRLQQRRIGCDLVAQIEARERARQQEKASEYEREKEQVVTDVWMRHDSECSLKVGEVVTSLLKELEDERKQVVERQRRHADMFQETTRERARQQQLLQEQNIREENEIKEYQELQRQRAEDLAKEKDRVRKEKSRVLNELLQSQIQKQKEQTDYAQLVADLYEYEREEQEKRKDEAQRQKREEEKALLSVAFKEHMKEKERKRQATLAEEAKFRRELYTTFAKEAKLEQLTQQKRMQTIFEHNRQVQAIIQERCRKREKDREREKLEHVKTREHEAAKQTIIRQERERLLREHAELSKFLPKNTLRDEREKGIVSTARQHASNTTLDGIQPLPRTLRPAPLAVASLEADTIKPQSNTLAHA